jgi:ketosteroid isomerase-like protein
MSILNRRVTLAIVVGLLSAAVLSAQDAASEIRKMMDAERAAAVAKDVKAYERFLADDLRWVIADGSVFTKQERLKEIPAGGTPPSFGEMDVKVFGDSAMVVTVATNRDGSRVRLARTYVTRDGRWQLVLHAATPMK